MIATLKHFGNQALGFRVKLGTTSAKAKNPGQCFFCQSFDLADMVIHKMN
jgi:hypothetical protein